MILALDGGLANLGYAVLEPSVPVRVHEVGLITSEANARADQSTDDAQRTRRAVATLRAIVERWHVTGLAAESMSFGGPPKGRHRMTVCLCLFWGAIVCMAELLNLDLLEVTPKQWQHAVVGTGDKVSYPQVEAALSDYVSRQAASLDAIPMAKRNHALDAVGVGLFATVQPYSAFATCIRSAEVRP